MYISFASRQILRLPRIHQVHFKTRLFEDVVYGDPIHACGLHGDGPNPALLQPIRHRLQLGGGAPEPPYRLAVPARRYSYIVGFVADINARSIGMHHFQTEVFALDFQHHLPPLLAVHLSPMALRWMVGCFLGFLLWLWFHANLSRLNSTWPGPVGETYTISPAGSGLLSFSVQGRHHLYNRQYRSHAFHRAGTLQRKCGLSCRARLCRRFYLHQATPKTLKEFQTHTTTPKGWPVLFKHLRKVWLSGVRTKRNIRRISLLLLPLQFESASAKSC